MKTGQECWKPSVVSLRLGCGTWSQAGESRGRQEASRGLGRGTGREPCKQPGRVTAGEGAREGLGPRGAPKPLTSTASPLGDATHLLHVSCLICGTGCDARGLCGAGPGEGCWGAAPSAPAPTFLAPSSRRSCVSLCAGPGGGTSVSYGPQSWHQASLWALRGPTWLSTSGPEGLLSEDPPPHEALGPLCHAPPLRRQPGTELWLCGLTFPGPVGHWRDGISRGGN